MKKFFGPASHLVGLGISLGIGWILFYLIHTFFVTNFPVWHHVPDLVGYGFGMAVGALAAYEIFVRHRQEVTAADFEGVLTFFGKLLRHTPTLRKGQYWLPPFFGAVPVPAPGKQIPIIIKGGSITARDGVKVLFAHEEPAQVFCSVSDPITYLEAGSERDDRVIKAYLGAVHRFFRDAKKALHARQKGDLLLDYLNLELGADHSAFEERLEKETYLDGQGTAQRLFDETAVRTLMEDVEMFPRALQECGYTLVSTPTPSIQLPPLLEEAETEREAVDIEMDILHRKTQGIANATRNLYADGRKPSDDFATALAAKAAGVDVGVQDMHISFSGNSSRRTREDVTRAVVTGQQIRGGRNG